MARLSLVFRSLIDTDGAEMDALLNELSVSESLVFPEYNIASVVNTKFVFARYSLNYQ